MSASPMTGRAFLVRGLLVGLLAGFASFLVAHQVGEPHVERAVALEQAGVAEHSHDAASGTGETAGTSGHSHDEETAAVSRSDQRTWGLLTGTLAIGLALGGLIALISAAVVGRLGRLTPGQSTAVVALVGFVSFALVPFLKYPATPPAAGSGDTIGARTGYYFLFVLLSVVVAIAAVTVAQRLWRQRGAYAAVTIAAVGYVAMMVVIGEVMPSAEQVGDFPADTLWFFRRASLMTLAALWAVIGIGLTGFVGRLHQQMTAATARRELAASL